MVATVHAEIRLDTDLTGQLPTNTYEVALEGYEDIHLAAVLTERALDGTLLVHRTMNGAIPLLFTSRSYILILTRAEKDRLLGDLGKLVYFMGHFRDDADVATYRSVVLFKSVSGVTIFDPQMNWWRAQIYLESASGLTVD